MGLIWPNPGSFEFIAGHTPSANEKSYTAAALSMNDWRWAAVSFRNIQGVTASSRPWPGGPDEPVFVPLTPLRTHQNLLTLGVEDLNHSGFTQKGSG
jgi:hypothetical protein